MSKLKIFVIGFPKSGTSSLHHAFNESGIISYHQFFKPKGKKKKYVADIMYKNFNTHNDIFASFNKNKIAITQADYTEIDKWSWPQLDYKLLEKTFNQPDVKFILNYRNPKKILDSVNRWHNNYRERIINADLPGLPIGQGTLDSDMTEWFENHFKKCRKLFSYNPQKFLEIDIESDTVKKDLSQFLNTEIVWWGTKNKNKK